MHKRAENTRKRSERHLERRSERRRLKPEVRRAELVDAALSVLRSHDPAEVRVEDVTRAAGAAKGTFYLYFSSWNELLAAVRDRVLADITSQVFDGFAVVGTIAQWWAALEEQTARFIDFHVGLGTLHQAIFHGPVTEHPMEADASGDRVIARLLRQGMALGACRQLDADLAAPLVFALLHATADGIVRSGGREERVEALLELLRAWLETPSIETDH